MEARALDAGEVLVGERRRGLVSNWQTWKESGWGCVTKMAQVVVHIALSCQC